MWWEFSTSGEFLYSCTFDENPDYLIWPNELPEGADYLWDTSTGARVCQYGERDAGDCVVAPGGDVAIDVRHDRDMELFDVSNAATSSPLPSTADTLGSVLFFANPGFLPYSRPNMWQSRSRVRFDSTGKYAITVLQNGIRIWQCKPAKLMGDVPLRDWTGLCAISPSGKYAAIEPVREPDARGSVIVYDIASTPVRQLGQIELPGPMTGMQFLNDDCLLAVDTRTPARTSVFDVRSMQEDASYSSVPGSEVQFARYITTGSKRRRRQPLQNIEWSGALGKVRVLCVPNQDAIVMFKHSVPSVRCACFSPNGGVLYVATEHQVVGLDVLTGSQLFAVDVGGDVCSIASSPKDGYVAAQTDREIVVLSIDECLRNR